MYFDNAITGILSMDIYKHSYVSNMAHRLYDYLLLGDIKAIEFRYFEVVEEIYRVQ